MVAGLDIIGVDNGYWGTKTSEGIIFESKFKEDDIFNDCKTITIDGKKYCIGKGIGIVDINKIDTEHNRVCLFTALAMSSMSSKFKVVTGLPIGQYKKQHEQFKESIMKKNRSIVNYLGYEREIKIEDVKVYAQGAGALFSQEILGNAIIIDIGYRTIDVALFEVESSKRNLVTYTTLFDGILPLCHKVMAEVNARYELGLPMSYGENVMKNGLIVDGEPQNTDFIKLMIVDHLKSLFEDLETKYPYRTTPIYLCGGGSYLLHKIIAGRYKKAELLKMAQFANANGYKRIGEKIWQ